MKKAFFALMTAIIAVPSLAEDVSTTNQETTELNLVEQKGRMITQSALDFGEYVDTRPENVILFETTTREIDFESKEMWITDVSKMTPPSIFETYNYASVKEFTADFSGIPIDEVFNPKTYPEKRIESECELTVEDYGLYIEGKFIGENVFYVDKLKMKKINENHLTGYCDYKEKLIPNENREFQEIKDFERTERKGFEEMDLLLH